MGLVTPTHLKIEIANIKMTIVLTKPAPNLSQIPLCVQPIFWFSVSHFKSFRLALSNCLVLGGRSYRLDRPNIQGKLSELWKYDSVPLCTTLRCVCSTVRSLIEAKKTGFNLILCDTDHSMTQSDCGCPRLEPPAHSIVHPRLKQIIYQWTNYFLPVTR